MPAQATARIPPPPAGAPRGFTWIKQGKLAGTPRPGIVDDVDHDLTLLKLAGLTHLVCLEERRTVSASLLQSYGITGIFFPIVDMGAPAVEDAAEMCRLLANLIGRGAVVGVHCRAGLGRTGTMLAALLIHGGADALAAVEEIRLLQPKYVQSDAQLEFLAAWLPSTRTSGAKGQVNAAKAAQQRPA
jgi:atypical dual specificity phosphatase